MSNSYDKLSATVPDWLKSLPEGQYTINDIIKITKASRGNIFMRLEKLKVKKKIVRKEHLWTNVYDWRGAKYYIQEEFKRKMKEMEAYGSEI